ncbi:MAG TPA: S8 family serine peptidase, partial [Tahibacter sp.]|nr:S8 family serine peptidase [Tahibacter sp.]
LNTARTGPTAPGYRAWLESLNFSTNPADYPLLAVVDDGIGNGSAVAGAGDESLTTNGAGIESRIVSALGCSGNAPESLRGHGHMNASIAAGYDDASGFPYRDPDGYRRREGVNPWARLSNIDMLGEGLGPECGGNDAGLIAVQGAQGVRVSTNSWGFSPDGGLYDAASRAYDLGTRDADPADDAHQPIAFVFAAGNFGPNLRTIASPGNAKNVITVGASENHRYEDEDGPWFDERCGVVPTDADNAMDIAPYSSRGPASGGRAKPELVAPGTNIQGSASTSIWYDGSGACQKYPPDNQTELSVSMGTSLSAPAIAGAATLVHRYLETSHLAAAPSPALVKSYLIAHPTYLTGLAANDTLPSPTQGFGMPNLGDAFAPDAARVLVDQTHVFGAAGEVWSLHGIVADDAKPVRIVLSWTDAPGAVHTQSPSVNDLDLAVTVRGVTYRGNRFNGRWSTPGGDADTANNTEAIYLPPGTNGPIEIVVTSRNVAGDGVPGNDDATDQDFALTCTNCSQAPDFYVAAVPPAQLACHANAATWPVDVGAIAGYAGSVTLTARGLPAHTSAGFSAASGKAPFATSFSLVPSAALAQGDYTFRIEGTDATHTKAGTLTLRYSPERALTPDALLPADGVSDVNPTATLTWSTSPEALDYTVEIDDDPAFGSIERSATVTGGTWTVAPMLLGATRYYWRVRANNACGPSDTTPARAFTTQPKFCAAPGGRISADGIGLTVQVTLPPLGTITDLDVAFATNHTWTGDLSLRLAKGTRSALLLDRPGEPSVRGGCGGADADLVLDDEAEHSAEEFCNSAGTAYQPAGGHFRPNQPLAAFDGIEAGGTYEVTVVDAVVFDDGVVQSLCLLPSVQPLDPDTIFADGFDE